MTQTEHYEKYENLIHKEAWRKARLSYGRVDFEDLVAEGRLAYCEALQTWDQDKGAFSTHLTWRLRHRLNKALAYGGHQDISEAHNVADDSDPHRDCSLDSALAGLGREAREVVGLVLGSSGEFADFTANCIKVTRGNIRAFLRSLKWPGRKVDKAIDEIKNMLRTL